VLDRQHLLLQLYDLYVQNLQLMLSSGPDKEILEAVRKFLKDEGINAESADRRASANEVASIVSNLPYFDPEEEAL